MSRHRHHALALALALNADADPDEGFDAGPETEPGLGPWHDDEAAAPRVAGCALLIDGGRHALVPAALVDASTTALQLRNGIGQSVAARRDGRAAAHGGAALFRLQSPLPFERGDAAWRRLPFAGSPAFVAEYPAGVDGAGDAGVAPRPRLRPGLLGGRARDGERRLGIWPGAGQRGGAVLDAHARVIGLALPGAFEAGWLPAAAGAEASGGDAGASTSPSASIGQAYERVLRVALQVVVVGH